MKTTGGQMNKSRDIWRCTRQFRHKKWRWKERKRCWRSDQMRLLFGDDDENKQEATEGRVSLELYRDFHHGLRLCWCLSPSSEAAMAVLWWWCWTKHSLKADIVKEAFTMKSIVASESVERYGEDERIEVAVFVLLHLQPSKYLVSQVTSHLLQHSAVFKFWSKTTSSFVVFVLDSDSDDVLCSVWTHRPGPSQLVAFISCFPYARHSSMDILWYLLLHLIYSTFTWLLVISFIPCGLRDAHILSLCCTKYCTATVHGRNYEL